MQLWLNPNLDVLRHRRCITQASGANRIECFRERRNTSVDRCGKERQRVAAIQERIEGLRKLVNFGILEPFE